MAITTHQFTGTFVADPAHSSFRFSVRHMSIATFTATFDDVDVRVVADGTGLAVEGSARVESVTIKSPPEFREHVVYGGDFFDARTYPEITFASDDVRLSEDGSAALTGALTIKGITKPFTATGTYQPVVVDPFGSQRTGFDFTATVDRRDWGMNYQAPLPNGANALGYAVVLNAQLELVKRG